MNLVETLSSKSSVSEVLNALEAESQPKMLSINLKHGNDFGVKLTTVRAIAKKLKGSSDLLEELWVADNTAAQLVAVLLMEPKKLSVDQVNGLYKRARAPKVREWLISYIAKKSPHLEGLRILWLGQDDSMSLAAGWELTAHQVLKNPEVLDLEDLLQQIHSRMGTVDYDLQWAMNSTLASIGIHHEEFRKEALSIGEELQVFADYPTPKGCTSPFAPIWINEIVSRQKA